ncbi:condensation domain-containing protein, partial [Deltaproteobacteria bacterium TL4]
SQQVTVLNQTPGAFYTLIQEAMQHADLKLALRYVIFGGEALKPPQLKPWFARFPQVKLINMYGITETTVHVTYKELTARDMDSAISGIGRPIPTLSVYLMDEAQNLVPVGVPGEIHVGGLGVARGYLNREELNRERFIPNPFHPEERLYRSGDLAKYLPNGELVYLGRIDHQVKVRGFRIELGEIEHLLTQHEQVRQAVILVKTDNNGHQQLAAYLVPKNSVLDLSDLRRFLKVKLPDYMVPALFFTLTQLPLTPNGKVNRKELLALEIDVLSAKTSSQAPQNEVEQALVEIWQEVLPHQPISTSDNFFELGGDSILSTQIVVRAKRRLLQLSVRQIFEHQTIAALAPFVTFTESDLMPQTTSSGSVPLTPIQSWFFEKESAGLHHFNQDVLLKIPDVFEVTILKQALEEVVKQHDALRLRFTQTEEGWTQHYQEEGAHFSIEVFDLKTPRFPKSSLDIIQKEANRLHTSFDLAQGPLMRVAVFKGKNQSGRLLIVIHHLVIDGVSW